MTFASPVEPSGASWLINCLLELGVRVDHKPVVDKVWRNSRPRPPASHMWQAQGDGYVLNAKADELRKWLPVLSRSSPLRFRSELQVDYVQDVALPEQDAQAALFFVRDPRDALYSMYKRRPREQTLDEFLAFPHPLTLLDRIDQWTLQVSSWLRHPHVAVFRFEDYKRDASALLARVLEWLAIEVSDGERSRAVAESTYEKAKMAEARYREAHPGDFELANRAGRVGDYDQDPDTEGLVRKVERQAGELLQALGYAVRGELSEPASMAEVCAGFEGAANLQRLPVFRQYALAQALRATTAAQALDRSAAKVLAFAEAVDAPALRRSGLPAADVRQLLDSLIEFQGAPESALARRLGELRQEFAEGADYHWQGVRALLAHRRKARRTAPAATPAGAPGVLKNAGKGAPGVFDPATLLARAQAESESPLAPVVDQSALEALCASFRNSPLSLTFFGRARAEHALVNAMVKRGRLTQYLQRYPEISTMPLARPLVIVSPFRTGTTFAHRLLAQDPTARWTRSWEVFLPPPPSPQLRGEAAYFSDDPRIATTRRFNRGLKHRHPHLAALHATDPQLPEECFGLLETTLLSPSFTLLGVGEDYLDYLEQLPAEAWQEVYGTYVEQLRLLQWWWPGERWLLKSPFHLWNLDAIAQALPEARFIQLHRSPEQVALSFCELLRATYSVIAKPVDPHWLGRFARELLSQSLRHGVRARQALPSDRFLSIPYRSLVEKPLESADRIRRFAGWEADPRAEHAMSEWLAAGSSRPSPAERPTLAWYGLKADALAEDFAPYQSFAPS